MVETIIANLISFAIAIGIVLPAMLFYLTYDIRKKVTKAYRLSRKRRGIPSRESMRISSHAKAVAALNSIPTTSKTTR